MLNGKFDFIIGNPPWIAWENLPEQYRESSKNLWKNYKLAEFRGGTGMGKAKKDLSMLFLVRSFNLYLKEGGKLGFLMTFTIFKSQAGAGFRKYLINNTKIHIIHDLVTLRPFEGAINRTGAIVVEKTQGKDTINAQRANMGGVKHIIWDGKQIPPDTTLEEVLRTTRRYNAVMIPLILNDPSSPWMQTTQHIIHAIRKIINGEQYYEAHAGVYPGINQIYYVKILKKTPDNYLIITNPSESGQKKKVKQIEAKIEPDLVYPLIRGRDIKKWFVDFKGRYIIMPVDSQGRDINLNNMKIKYPYTYNYFYTFFNDLINRGGEPYKSKLKPYKEIPFQEAEKVAPPFYWIFNAKHSLAPYKVVWQRIAGAITGKAVSFACAVIEPIKGIPLIPDDGTILIEAGTRDEAYYIAGFLNSLIVRTIIASYTYELRQETHIADIIKIPKFDPNNQFHVNLSNLSQKAHELTICIFANDKPDYCLKINAEKELNSIENKIDFIVAKLLELSENDLERFRDMMSILSGNR
jgi:type II restriction/modification system DNA methylase subunit YeeA